MVDVTKFLPQEGTFEESATATPVDFPKGSLKIESVKEVVIKGGVSQGQEKIAIKMRDESGKLWSYFPNKTSVAILVKKFGNESDGWIGKTFSLETVPERVKGQKKAVLYVKE